MLHLTHLAELVGRYPAAIDAAVREFDIGSRFFRFNSKPAVMGVINLSNDSWYRESVCLNTEQAMRRAAQLLAQGADLVDIGAESTLGRADRSAEKEQTDKLLPVVEPLAAQGALVSVETYYAGVAVSCLEAGAKLINLTGPMESEAVYQAAAAHQAAVILCYVHGRHVRDVTEFDLSQDPVDMMRPYFEKEIALAAHHGLERLFIDPGLGFYYRNLNDSTTRVRHQMQVLLNSFRLRTLGYPVCHALPHAFEQFGEEVRSAEPFFAVLAALGKTDLYRTHEVARVRAVLDTLQLHQD